MIGALDDVRARTHRLAVVGQISFPEAPETAHTAVLGPFSCRGILDSQEKFLRAVAGPSRARQAGQDLAWDTKTGKGRGRFMLAPAFMRPRDAFDFYRQPVPDRFAWIASAIQRWEAGESREAQVRPVCHCGTRTDQIHQTSVGPAYAGPCPVHGRAA